MMRKNIMEKHTMSTEHKEDTEHREQAENWAENQADHAEEILAGGRLWMAENLNVDMFSNGDPIREASTDEDWEDAGMRGEPAWRWASDDPAERFQLGKLYNWYAIEDSRGLAPDGLRIPAAEELQALVTAEQLLTKEIRPPRAGRCSEDGVRTYVAKVGCYWSETPWESYAQYLLFYCRKAGIRNCTRASGRSVRCLMK